MAIYEQWKQTYPRTRCPGTTWRCFTESRDSRKRPWPMPAKRCASTRRTSFRLPTSPMLTRLSAATTKPQRLLTKPLPKGWDPRRMPFRSIHGVRPGRQGRNAASGGLGKGTVGRAHHVPDRGQGQCALGKIQSARQTFAQGVSLAQNSGLKELAAGTSPDRRVLPGRSWQSRPRPAGGIAGAGRFE